MVLMATTLAGRESTPTLIRRRCVVESVQPPSTGSSLKKSSSPAALILEGQSATPYSAANPSSQSKQSLPKRATVDHPGSGEDTTISGMMTCQNEEEPIYEPIHLKCLGLIRQMANLSKKAENLAENTTREIDSIEQRSGAVQEHLNRIRERAVKNLAEANRAAEKMAAKSKSGKQESGKQHVARQETRQQKIPVGNCYASCKTSRFTAPSLGKSNWVSNVPKNGLFTAETRSQEIENLYKVADPIVLTRTKPHEKRVVTTLETSSQTESRPVDSLPETNPLQCSSGENSMYASFHSSRMDCNQDFEQQRQSSAGSSTASRKAIYPITSEGIYANIPSTLVSVDTSGKNFAKLAKLRNSGTTSPLDGAGTSGVGRLVRRNTICGNRKKLPPPPVGGKKSGGGGNIGRQDSGYRTETEHDSSMSDDEDYGGLVPEYDFPAYEFHKRRGVLGNVKQHFISIRRSRAETKNLTTLANGAAKPEPTTPIYEDRKTLLKGFLKNFTTRKTSSTPLECDKDPHGMKKSQSEIEALYSVPKRKGSSSGGSRGDKEKFTLPLSKSSQVLQIASQMRHEKMSPRPFVRTASLNRHAQYQINGGDCQFGAPMSRRSVAVPCRKAIGGHHHRPSNGNSPKSDKSSLDLDRPLYLGNDDLSRIESGSSASDSTYSCDPEGFYTSMHKDAGVPKHPKFRGQQPLKLSPLSPISAETPVKFRPHGAFRGRSFSTHSSSSTIAEITDDQSAASPDSVFCSPEPVTPQSQGPTTPRVMPLPPPILSSTAILQQPPVAKVRPLKKENAIIRLSPPQKVCGAPQGPMSEQEFDLWLLKRFDQESCSLATAQPLTKLSESLPRKLSSSASGTPEVSRRGGQEVKLKIVSYEPFKSQPLEGISGNGGDYGIFSRKNVRFHEDIVDIRC